MHLVYIPVRVTSRRVERACLRITLSSGLGSSRLGLCIQKFLSCIFRYKKEREIQVQREREREKRGGFAL